MRQDKDRCGKWLLSRHGDAVLKMAGVTGFTSWRHLSNELVAPRRIFDGLLEVTFPNEPDPTLVLIEIESYPGSDADRQVFDDVLLVTLEHGVVPEVLSLVLKPKGNVEVTGTLERTSRRGGTRIRGIWPVVRMWELAAEDLLASGDVGMVPWAALAHTDKQPEQLLGECVARIDQVPDAVDRSGLLATTEILAGLAFPKMRFPNLFRGPGAMIESPILDEVREILRQKYREEGKEEGRLEGRLEGRRQTYHEMLLRVLEKRFQPLSSEQAAIVNSISDPVRLEDLTDVALTCANLDEFFAAVSASKPGI